MAPRICVWGGALGGAVEGDGEGRKGLEIVTAFDSRHPQSSPRSQAKTATPSCHAVVERRRKNDGGLMIPLTGYDLASQEFRTYPSSSPRSMARTWSMILKIRVTGDDKPPLRQVIDRSDDLLLIHRLIPGSIQRLLDSGQRGTDCPRNDLAGLRLRRSSSLSR